MTPTKPFEISILHAPESALRWNLVYDYMKLRHEVFMTKKNWSLHAHAGVEFEQYDALGLAYYVLAHKGDTVIAGCRLIRCDSVIGRYTYMIKDAYDGRISLPREICDAPPPTDAQSWELTRLVSRRHGTAAKAVLEASNIFLAAMGAERCLCLAAPAARRLGEVAGYSDRKSVV